MTLKQFTIEIQEFGKKSSLRADFRFAKYIQSNVPYAFIYFKNYIKNISNGKDIPKEDYVSIEDTEIIYPTVNNIKKEGLILNEVTAIDSGFIGGYYVDDKDIVITRSGTVGITKCWSKDEINTILKKEVESIPSGYLIVVKIDQSKINPLFVEYLLNSKLFSEYFNVFGVGKSQKNISQGDIKYLPFPLIPKITQDKIVTQIAPIEKKIRALNTKIIPQHEVINKVFTRELGFNLKKFEELKKNKYFELDISTIDTPLIRSTVIQNKKSSNYLKVFLNNNTVSLKKILIKPIKRGKQPEYTEDGVKVIKTLNIQKGKINFDEVQFVSEEFLKDNEEKAGIYKFDLLLTSTGMGRGKFAMYEDDEVCFADSHISIIRFDRNKYITFFLNYYCQSLFGLEQLKYIETHIKGTPEIYEDQLNYFKIPNISLNVQQKIVKEITAELDKQNDVKNRIESERNKIDEIIETAID